MKKIVTLLFVILGCVGQAMATDNPKLYIENGDPTNWTDIDVYAWQSSKDTNNNKWDTNHPALSTVNLYGTTWYVFEMSSNYDCAIIRGSDASNWDAIKTGTLSVTSDLYVTVTGGQGSVAVYRRNYIYPVFRNDIDANWDSNSENATAENAFTFYRDFSKSTIDTYASTKSRTNFDFRFKAGYDFGGGYWPQIYPGADNTSLPIGSTLVNAYENQDGTTYAWQVTIPTSYNYDKIRLTAAYRKKEGVWKWEISADAYISKEISYVGYATFGSNASVDFSKAIPAEEGKSFTARKGKVNTSTGKITYSDVTTLYGGEGALLHGDAGTYSIPVTTSASADPDNNDFKAIDTKQKITQDMSSLKAYILTNKNSILGFYKPADEGSWCAATTAYLGTSYDITSAREFFPVWEETPASVDAVLTTKGMENGSFYNLAGQQVAKPTKGLYIVNGKKVVIK